MAVSTTRPSALRHESLHGERPPRRRQFVLVLTDTQSASLFGCYGAPAGLTPCMDQHRTTGCLFERAYCASPVCGPSRSAIFTGTYPHTNGVLANHVAPGIDHPTIGQRLQRAGIRTGYIGKWHLDGLDYFGTGTCPDGWDPAYWYDFRTYLAGLSPAEVKLAREVHDPASVAQHGITAEFTWANRIKRRALEFIDRHRNEDFFLVVSIDEPHHPYICPEPHVSRFEEFDLPMSSNCLDPLAGKPAHQRDWAGVSRERVERARRDRDGACRVRQPRFLGCHNFCDTEVGDVLDRVRAALPDAVTLFTSDHGEMLGAHGLLGKGPAMYDEITRVPLILWTPGEAPPNRSYAHPVTHLDITPTVLEFFGRQIPEIMPGRSLLRAVVEPDTRLHEMVFLEFNRFEVDHDGFGAFQPIRAVFDGRHKLSLNLLDVDEFYDLATDPAEVVNRIDAPEYAAVRDHLHQRIIDFMNESRDLLRGPNWIRRPWSTKAAPPYWGGGTRARLDDGVHPPALNYLTAELSPERYVPFT